MKRRWIGQWFTRAWLRMVGADPAPRPRRPHRSDSLTAQKVLDALRYYSPQRKTVQQLEAGLGSKTVQAALYALMRDGFVAREREGRRYVYRLEPTTLDTAPADVFDRAQTEVASDHEDGSRRR